jgi:O-antigen ligase
VAVSILLLTGVATQVWKRFRAGPLLLFAPIALGLPTLAFTQSRGALMGLVAGMAVIVVLSLADKQLAPLVVLMTLVAAVVTVVVMSIPAQQTQEFLTRVTHTQLSVTNNAEDFGRTAIYHVALQTMSQHPLTGVGPLAFGKIMEHSALSASFQGGAITAHNIYLETFLSVGPLGLIAFLWICAGAARRLWRARPSQMGREGSLSGGWALGSLAVLACMLVHGLVDFVFWQVELLMFYFAILGLAYALDRRPRAGRPGVLR